MSASLHDHVDVVIAGGGITGASCFYHLASRTDLDVLLLEARGVNFGSTARSPAAFRHQFSSRMNVQMSRYSGRLFHQLHDEHDTETLLVQNGYRPSVSSRCQPSYNISRTGFDVRSIRFPHPTLTGPVMSELVFDALLDKLMPIGRERVEEDQNEFLPFAAAMTPENEIKYVGPETEQTFPSPPDALNYLNAGMKRMASEGRIEASALVSPVEVKLPDAQEESDAIRFHLEFKDGTSSNVYLPFDIDELTGEVSWGDPFELEAESRVFE